MSITFAAVICDADDPCSVNTAYAPESSFTMSPWSTTLILYFWYWSSNSEFLRWQGSINDEKWTFIPLFLASSITSFLFLTSVSCCCWNFLQFFQFLYHCCLCIWNFHCLRHRNELVNKTVMSHRTRSFRSDVILMRFVYSSLDPWSCALVGINNTSKSCLAFPKFAVGLPTAIYWYFASHCCWHRNFLLSSSGSDYELEFFIVWFDEVYSSPLSGIIEFQFLDSPSLFRFLLCCIRHTRPHIWPYIVRTRGCLFSCKSPPRPCVPIRWPFVQKDESCESCPCIWLFFSPSTIQSSSICFPTLRLVRKMLFWVLRRKKKCFFFRHVQFDSWYNVMTMNDFSCDRPEIVFRFLVITGWVFFKMRWSIPFIWISLKNFLFLRLVPVGAGLRWMFADAVLGVEFRCVHLLQFFNVCDQNVYSPDSLRELFTAEKNTWQAFLCRTDAVATGLSQKIGWYWTIAPKGITGPSKGIPNRLSWGVFTSESLSWMFRR